MTLYKLMKDLPTFRTGDIFKRRANGDLVWDASIQEKITDEHGRHWKPQVVLYSNRTLIRFPEILENWFEEVVEPKQDYLMNAWRGNDAFSSGNMVYLEFSTTTAAKKALKKIEAWKELLEGGDGAVSE